MNFLRSKIFVSNDLTKGFQTKSAVKKCYLSRKKYLKFNKRNSEENWRGIINKCFSYLYFSYENLLI